MYIIYSLVMRLMNKDYSEPDFLTQYFCYNNYLHSSSDFNDLILEAKTEQNKSSSSSPIYSESPTKKSRKGKTAHNLVEKKYRTSINSAIQKLRDRLPYFKTENKVKNNKSNILYRALVYIEELEAANSDLEKKNQELALYLNSVEKS